MQRLRNCDIILDIELIELVSGGNEYFEVVFSTKDGSKYKFIFDFVWDMRYSIENASIARFCQFRKCLPEELVHNSVYMVEDSDYIKYFEEQVDGTRPVDELKHYVLLDSVDTTLDVLTLKEPKLIQM